MTVPADHPLISVIIPCYNEQHFIEKCVGSVLDCDYPKDRMEIFIIDGNSTDGTQAIVRRIIERNKECRIEWLKNEKRFFPHAVNMGVRASKGDYIFILGSHSLYDKSYFSLSVKTILEYNADNAGGILETIGLNESCMGKAISNVLSCRFGVGNSVFRTGTDKITETDTVFGGCYRREVFDRIGFFNEDLTSSSDMDFNVRLRKSGGKIILNPAIKATYYTRNYFGKFFRNNLRNGYWAIYPMRFVDYLPVSLRHLIPLFFFLGIALGAALAFLSQWIMILFLSGLGIYILLSVYFALTYLKKGFCNLLLMPFLFFVIHFSYGLSSFWALAKIIFHRVLKIFGHK